MSVPAPAVQAQGLGAVNADYLNSLVSGCFNVAQARSFTGVANQIILVMGTATPADNGQSLFYYDPDSTAPDDGGASVIAPTGSTQGRWLILPLGGSGTGNIPYVLDTGTTNALAVTLNPAPLAYTTGLSFIVEVANDTTAVFTINVNGLGPIPVRFHADSAAKGKLLAGEAYLLALDSAGHFEVLSPSPTILPTTIRIRLASPTTFYVATTGSDSNDGLSAGTPWLTIQHAIAVLHENYDLAGQTATIQCATGAYNAEVNIQQPFTGSGFVVIQGDEVTPANVSITVTGGANNCLVAENNAVVAINGFTFASGNIALYALTGGVIRFQNCVFGACTDSQLHTNSGGHIFATGPYTIKAGGSYHAEAFGGEIDLLSAGTITLTSNPAFSGALYYASSSDGVVFCGGITYSGTGTGPGWVSNVAAYVDTGDAGAAIMAAGFSAGSTSGAGQFA